MKSIRARITYFVIIAVVAANLITAGVSIFLNYSSTTTLLEHNLNGTVKLASERINQELSRYKAIAIETGNIARLTNPEVTLEDKKLIIETKSLNNGFVRGNVLDVNGNSIFDENNYADREYFQEAMKGNAFVSDPVVSKVTGVLTLIVAAPLWKDGIQNTEVVGCVYFVPEETLLSEIMSTINISENSSAYIISKDGKTIAHEELQKVKDNENIEELAKTDAQYLELANAHSKMHAQENGYETYSFKGQTWVLSYAVIPNTPGWTIAITAPMSDYLGQTNLSVVILLIIVVVAVIITVLVSFIIAGKISKPIKLCAERLSELANGDLKSPVPSFDHKDEIGLLSNSTKTVVEQLNYIIGDLGNVLSAMANGDLTVSTQCDFDGDYVVLKNDTEKVLKHLNTMLINIEDSAENVNGSAEQVSGGSQALSQGATEQAAAIEELSATIIDISEKTKNNAKNANKANILSVEASTGIAQSNEKMNEMTNAMNDISAKANEIRKIIKTIDDIAFQTNILALNAAVEAARAGEAGKGFAVVADEVRNLAQKSAEAAKNTTALIDGTVDAVNNGSLILNNTAASLISVVEISKKVSSMITEIAQASEEQAEGASQIASGIDQISSVVQNNSATAEESAAASEELNSQAQMLKGMVNRFKLK